MIILQIMLIMLMIHNIDDTVVKKIEKHEENDDYDYPFDNESSLL